MRLRLAYLSLPLTFALLALTSGCHHHRHFCCGAPAACCAPCGSCCGYTPPLEGPTPPLAVPPPAVSVSPAPVLGLR